MSSDVCMCGVWWVILLCVVAFPGPGIVPEHSEHLECSQ